MTYASVGFAITFVLMVGALIWVARKEREVQALLLDLTDSYTESLRLGDLAAKYQVRAENLRLERNTLVREKERLLQTKAVNLELHLHGTGAKFDVVRNPAQMAHEVSASVRGRLLITPVYFERYGASMMVTDEAADRSYGVALDVRRDLQQIIARQMMAHASFR